jgi:hypothetical protein
MFQYMHVMYFDQIHPLKFHFLSFFFFITKCTQLCLDTTLSLSTYQVMDIYTDCISLDVVNSVILLKTWVCRWLPWCANLPSFGTMSRTGIAGLYVIVLFLVYLRKLHTIFHIGWTNSCSHQQCLKAPFSHIFINICYFFPEWLPFWLEWDGISMPLWLAFPLTLRMSNTSYIIGHLYLF